MRGSLVLVMFLLLCGSSVTAMSLGVAPHGVISGVRVAYVPTNLAAGDVPGNLSIDFGNAWIDGVQLYVSPMTGPVGAFCATTSISANASYYIYYVYISSSVQQYYISDVTPTSDGHPSSNLSVASGACTLTGTQKAVFVGSFTTNSAGQVRPFWRNGDEVLFDANGLGVGSSTVAFNRTDIYPECKPIIGGPNPLTAYPSSATSYLVQVVTLNQTTDEETVYACPPDKNTWATCGPVYQFLVNTPGASTPTGPGVRTENRQLQLKAGATVLPTFCMQQLTIGSAMTPDYQVTVNWVGYVEKVAHPVR